MLPKKNPFRKIFFHIYRTKYPDNPEKIGISKKTVGVGEKWKVDLDSAGPH